jgi:hypothetical protein
VLSCARMKQTFAGSLGALCVFARDALSLALSRLREREGVRVAPAKTQPKADQSPSWLSQGRKENFTSSIMNNKAYAGLRPA